MVCLLNGFMVGVLVFRAVGAKLMHKYKAHGATDVTGFGLLGHAKNLASAQKEEVSFVIDLLPIIADMSAIVKTSGSFLSLHQGYSAETSGRASPFCLPESFFLHFCRHLFCLSFIQ